MTFLQWYRHLTWYDKAIRIAVGIAILIAVYLQWGRA